MDVKKLKEEVEMKNHRLIVELRDDSKIKELVDFVRIQQGLIANQKLIIWLNELQKEE